MFSGTFSPMHWLVVLVIVLLIFGPGKLPSIGNALGKSIKNFKNAADSKDAPQSTDEKKQITDK